MEKHTPGPLPDNMSDAELAALVEKLAIEHRNRTPRQGWRTHQSALRRWRRERRTGGKLPPPAGSNQPQSDDREDHHHQRQGEPSSELCRTFCRAFCQAS